MVKKKEVKKELKGIGGWLLFFTIIIILVAIGKSFGVIGIILKPILMEWLRESMGVLSSVLDQRSNLFMEVISIIFTVASFALSWFTVYLIIKKKGMAKKIAIITLWVLFFITLFNSIFFIIEYPSLETSFKELEIYSEEIIEQTKLIFYVRTIFSFILSLGWTILWTAYFLKSKRVKNTFVK